MRSLATPARGGPLAPLIAATAAIRLVRLPLRVGVLPVLDIAIVDCVTFQLAREAHAVSTTLQTVRTVEPPTEDMLAPVIRLGRSFLGEVSANQPLSFVYTLNMDYIAKLLRLSQSLSHSVIAKENEVDVKASAPLKDCHAVLGEVILTLQSSNPLPNVMD